MGLRRCSVVTRDIEGVCIHKITDLCQKSILLVKLCQVPDSKILECYSKKHNSPFVVLSKYRQG